MRILSYFLQLLCAFIAVETAGDYERKGGQRAAGRNKTQAAAKDPQPTWSTRLTR